MPKLKEVCQRQSISVQGKVWINSKKMRFPVKKTNLIDLLTALSLIPTKNSKTLSYTAD